MQDPKTIRREFYDRLADAAGIPRRRRVPLSGYPIPYVQGHKAAVRVYGYSGHFDQPDKYGLPVPRIEVRLAGPWTYIDLEVTVALSELLAWAPWIIGWIRWRTGDRTATLPDPPTPVYRPWSEVSIDSLHYLWTVRADRTERREALQRLYCGAYRGLGSGRGT